MNLVNGYICRNCTDEELAKRGVDPAHPHRDVKDAQSAEEAKSAKDTPSTDENKKAESSKATSDERTERQRLGENRPLESGTVGTRLNLCG
jgi:hypothetical protein